MQQLDGVAKRQIVAGVALCMLAVQMQQVSSLYNGGDPSAMTTFVLVWTAIDAGFLVALKAARVPRLCFSWVATAGLALLALLINVSIAAAVNVWLLPSQLPFSVSDSLSYPMNPSRKHGDVTADTQFDSTHIQGSHMVKVVPPTIAKMNPSASTFCMQSSLTAPLTIPVQIKGTPPYTIDYSLVMLDGAVKTFSNVSVAALPNAAEKRGLAVYPITVKSPGVYKLTGLRDSTGMQGKVIETITEVSLCPDAHWAISNPAKRTIDRCVDDSVDFRVTVKASAGPIQVFYSRKVGSEEVVVRLESDETSTVSSVDSQGVEVDIGNEDDTWFGDSSVESRIRERIRAIQPRTVTLQSTFKPETPGVFFFRLLHLVDSRNNTVIFPSADTASSSSPGNAAASGSHLGNVVRISDRNPDVFVVDSHPHPTIRFANSEAAKIRSPIPGSSASSEVSPNSASVAQLTILFEGDGTAPWNFNVAHAASIHDAEEGRFTREWKYTSDTSKFNLQASLPGVYLLQSVSDLYCGGGVVSPYQTVVHQTFPPTISISAESIEQSCVGTIGALVNVSLTGDAPFWIGYDEVYRGVRTGKTAVINKLRDTLQFKPSLPGTYLYEFQSVGDATYTEGVPIENVSITQIIHPQSEARFTNPQKLTRCIGDSATLPVTLNGSGPWLLTYEIIFENKKERISVDAKVNADGGVGKIDLVTPNFESAGSYVVDLIEITDANGCSWLLETPDVSIEVLAQRPSASFNCPRVISMLEGDSALLPVSLSGRQPFNIKYINKEVPSIVHELKNIHDRETIRVRSPGVFEIIEISDNVCAGVAKPIDCTVKTIPKPKLEIPAKEYTKTDSNNVLVRESVCQGVEDSLEINASGKAPFTVKYAIDTLDAEGKKSHVSIKKEQAAGRVGRIPLMTAEPNTYLYTFTEITDDNYRRPTDTQLKTLVAIKQTVLGRPNAAFVDGLERVFQCLGDNPEDANSAISVRLDGTPPFDLTLELKHENHPREVIRLTNITERIHRFRPPTLSATGRYAIQLVSLRDASGCDRVFEREDESSGISVAVSDVARIASLNPESICVGDVLSYTLQGTPPFTITYEFDGVQQEPVQIVDPLLTLYAAEPGTVSVTLVCNHMNCCTRPSNLVNVIHNLPSAIVDGGKDTEEDIREGDETVIGIDFLGEPPFSFTYARRDLSAVSGSGAKKARSAAAKAEESFTITNIETHHYDITTSQEGLFHVTAVYDKHCGFPRVLQAVGSSNAVLRKK
ncbi:hypothetical protein CcCBS67573_g07267 [Chytriomyces confervae]|uniref:Uncharacterized protein n=1 Tax=Chytriomyces confervae TaxID=246404 RepID=A0A507EXS0_9FUNG|nr:hypothetical protein CcCBS67573_g07267 [Chytriomyces confervae]